MQTEIINPSEEQKPIFKLKIHSSTQEVVGRKINSYKKISMKKASLKQPINLIKDSKPKRKTEVRKRPLTDREAPKAKRTRSAGKFKNNLNTLTPGKEDKAVMVIPPKSARTKTQKRRQPSQVKPQESSPKPKKSTGKIKHIISETLQKNQIEKKEKLKKDQEKKLLEETKKAELKSTNDLIRKRNAKKAQKDEKLHSAAWGVDQRQFKQEGYFQRNLKTQEIREKRRAEREKRRAEGKAAIGLEHIKLSKKSPSKTKTHQAPRIKSYDPEIKKFMEQKKQTQRLNSYKAKQELLKKEQEREIALQKLEIKQKTAIRKSIKKKKKKKTKSLKGLKSPGRDSYLKEKFLELKERSQATFQSYFEIAHKNKAASKIQNWYRKIKAKEYRQNYRMYTESDYSPINSFKEPIKTTNSEEESEASFNFQDSDEEFRTSEIVEKFRQNLQSQYDEIHQKFLANQRVMTEQLEEVGSTPDYPKSFQSHESFEEEKYNLPRQLDQKVPPLELEKLNFKEKRPLELNIERIEQPFVHAKESSRGKFEFNTETNESEESEIFTQEIESPKVGAIEQPRSSDRYESERDYDWLKDSNSSEDRIRQVPFRFDKLEFKILEVPRIALESAVEENLFGTTLTKEILENEDLDELDYKEAVKDIENSFEKSRESPLEESREEKTEDFSCKFEEDSLEQRAKANKHRRKSEILSFENSQEKDESDTPEELKDAEEVPPTYFVPDLTEQIQAILVQEPIKQEELPPRLTSPPLDLSSPESGPAESSPNHFSPLPDAIENWIQKEIDTAISLANQQPVPNVDSSIDFIDDYMEMMLNILLENEEEILYYINSPIEHEPLERLQVLQSSEIGGLPKSPILELIIPSQVCNYLFYELESQEDETRKAYLQMLFDCFNEALNYIRPYGTKGEPEIWSLRSREVCGESDLVEVFKKARECLKKWVEIKGGYIPGEEEFLDNGELDQERLQNIREERMSVFLCGDVKEEEKNWLNYEEEEMQTKLDIADMVLEHLVCETIDLLQILSN